MTDADLTPEQIRDRITWLKAEARKGADALHAKAATHAKPPQLTDAESAAKARARLERSQP